jgi:ABC-2 type transport system ATP-binding protein
VIGQAAAVYCGNAEYGVSAGETLTPSVIAMARHSLGTTVAGHDGPGVRGEDGIPLAVSTTGLTKRFDDKAVVDELALAIPAGSVCGFVGPNGAGKTTTIRMLLGLIRPSSGTGTVLGGDLSDPPSYLDKVGALIESPAFYPQLSGRDNLRVLVRLGRIASRPIDNVLQRVGLAERASDRYRTYSLGMKQRLGIAAALLVNPELLVLDEPTNGLDPAGILEMRGLIRSLADDGITVFVSSHLISEIEHICDHVVMIQAGRSVYQGPVAELRARQGSDIVARPERAEDLDRLAELLRAAGYEVRVEPESDAVSDAVIIPTGFDGAAPVNRAAMNGGITLAYLAERHRSLEDAFFELTGTHSRDAEQRHELEAVQ